MGLFGKKKKQPRFPEERLDRAAFRRIATPPHSHRVYLPAFRPNPIISSREYRIYKHAENRKPN